MQVHSKILPPFPEQQGSLCIHSFFSFLEAPGQEENDAITTFLLHNRWMAGVNDPGDSLQPEISQNQTCLALIWKMGIFTFYLEKLYWSIFCYQQWRRRKQSTMVASSLFKDWFFTQIIDYTGVINALETEFQALIKFGTLGSLKYNWFCCCKEHKSFMIVLYDGVLHNVLISFP